MISDEVAYASRLDAEITAIEGAYRALQNLDVRARERALVWLTARFASEARAHGCASATVRGRPTDLPGGYV